MLLYYIIMNYNYIVKNKFSAQILIQYTKYNIIVVCFSFVFLALLLFCLVYNTLYCYLNQAVVLYFYYLNSQTMIITQKISCFNKKKKQFYCHTRIQIQYTIEKY